MADPPPRPETGEDIGPVPDRGSPSGTPRWVKVSVLVALVVVLAFVAMHLAGGGIGSH